MFRAHVLIIITPIGGRLLHETATYRCDDTRGCVMKFSPPDDEHMCSKHVEAWNKLIVKQKFCASSWLITEINHFYLVKFFNHIFFTTLCPFFICVKVSHCLYPRSSVTQRCTNCELIISFFWNNIVLQPATQTPSQPNHTETPTHIEPRTIRPMW